MTFRSSSRSRLRFRVRGRRCRGRAVDLRGDGATVEEVVDALGLDPDDPLATATTGPPPLERSLATAARESGRRTRVDDAIDGIEERLAAVDEEIAGLGDVTAALTAARERAAAAGSDAERLRERTATLRGRMRATEEGVGEAAGASASATSEPDDPREAFASATRALVEAETERVAAAQALARADGRARAARDARERRLRLRDALANRRREARTRLVEAAWPAFAEAVTTVPGDAAAGDEPGEVDGDPVAGHLAAVRLAERAEPVVVAAGRFGGPAEAATRLRAPVVLVTPE